MRQREKETNCKCEFQMRRDECGVSVYTSHIGVWQPLYPAFSLFRPDFNTVVFKDRESQTLTFAEGCILKIGGETFDTADAIFERLSEEVCFFFEQSYRNIIAENALYVAGETRVRLGGVLIENTVVEAAGFDLSFEQANVLRLSGGNVRLYNEITLPSKQAGFVWTLKNASTGECDFEKTLRKVQYEFIENSPYEIQSDTQRDLFLANMDILNLPAFLNLASAASFPDGRHLTIKTIGNGTLNIAAFAGDTIYTSFDNASIQLTVSGQSIDLVRAGNRWIVL